MKRTILITTLTTVFCASSIQAIHAQTMYKWVNAQGIISYSDQPPPPNQTVQDLSNTLNILGTGTAEVARLDYETAQLATQAPIVLYTSKGCTPCDLGRAFLKKKAYPFTEKTVNSGTDIAEFQTLFNTQSLPVLGIDKEYLNGYSAGQWDERLTAAGYSTTTVVPKTYVNGVVSTLTVPETKLPLPTIATNEGMVSKSSPRAVYTPPPAPVPEPIIRF